MNWSAKCQSAFAEIKNINVRIESDALWSKRYYCCKWWFEIGFRSHNIPQRKQWHVSRIILLAEKGVQGNWKSGLGIVFAVQKLQGFNYGRGFMLLTDQWPLLSSFGFKKGIAIQTAHWLQRFRKILLNYNFKRELLPSKRLGHADWLCRLIPKQCEPLEESVIATLRLEIKSVLCNTIRELFVTIEEIQNKAKIDKYITEKQKQIIDQQYKKIDGEKIFSICNGIFMYGEWVMILECCRKELKKDFHTGHPGISRIKALMRSYVFWPNMDIEIKGNVKSCKGCVMVAKAPPVKCTIRFLHELFARFSIPDKLCQTMAHNSRQEFKDFCFTKVFLIIASLIKAHIFHLVCVNMEAYDCSCLFQTM